MHALIAELRAIIANEAPSAVVCTRFASLHHKVRRDHEFHIRVGLQLGFWYLKLPQQIILVFEDSLTIHAVEASWEAEAKVWPSHCLEVARARVTMAKAMAVLTASRTGHTRVHIVWVRAVGTDTINSILFTQLSCTRVGFFVHVALS